MEYLEFIKTLDLGALTYVSLLTFGAVSAVSFVKPDLDSKTKLGLAFVFALLFGFINLLFVNYI